MIYIKDEYLKYLGWMSSDRSSFVRKETVMAIGAILYACKEENLDPLSHFVQRFMPRFAEIAVGIHLITQY